MKIENFKTDKEALLAMTSCLIGYMERKTDGHPFNLALSGGETAKKMFTFWVEEYKEKIDWDNIRFFWVDERRRLIRTAIMAMRTSFCLSRCISPKIMCTAFTAKWSRGRKRCAIRAL